MSRISYITRASLSFALLIAANSITGWEPCTPGSEITTLQPLLGLIGPTTYSLTWIGCFILGYKAPGIFRAPMALVALGLIYASMTITFIQQATMHVPIGLVIAGTCANNIGAPLFYLLWEQYFASEDDDQCIADILIGRGLPVVFFMLFGALSHNNAITILRALVFLGVTIALFRCYRTIDWTEPQFADKPSEHSLIYRNVMALSWKSALCIGALAFLYTMLQTAFISESPLTGALSYAPLWGMLVAAAIIMVLWRHRSFSFNVITTFRTTYPLLLALLLLLPFFANVLPSFIYGISYGYFSLLVCIGMVQCSQTCKRAGVGPVFMFGFYLGIANIMHIAGYLCGTTLVANSFFSQPRWFVTALVTMFVISLIFFLVRGDLDPKTAAFTSAEFIALDASDVVSQVPEKLPRAHNNNSSYFDRTAKQCATLGAQYRLTARETEVLELLARGNSVPGIAESLVVSQGTVQTHCKRLYAKLGVHKRQELISLVADTQYDIL